MRPQSEISPAALDTLLFLAASTPPGCFAEVGVYRGGSASSLLHLARKQGRETYLYDTFRGIPYKGEYDSHNVGDFGDVDLAVVMENLSGAIFRVGVFPHTLGPEKDIAFVHVDCDQYQSVLDCARIFPDRMVTGGIMLFDDYKCLAGATKAVEESFNSFNITPQGKAYWIKEG